MSFLWNMFSSTANPAINISQIVNEQELLDNYPFFPIIKASDHASILQTKERGNTAYSQKQYSTAISEYSKALSYFKSKVETPRGDDISKLPQSTQIANVDENESRNLLATLLCNRSAAYLNNFEFELAYFDSLGVIKWKPEWLKGYFRKGEALMGLRLFDRALVEYEKALKIVNNLVCFHN